MQGTKMISTLIQLVFLMGAYMIADVVSQPDPSVCTPHGPKGEGPPLPVLPEQYILRVEANIMSWNHTLELVEYYDAVHNRGAVQNMYKGNSSQWVLNYDTLQITTVESNGDCNVRNLTDQPFNIFGFRLQNGTAHIGSTADIFRFGSAYNETYMNTTYIRGIPADHWQSCLYEEELNRTSLLDYYFSVPGYTNSYNSAQVPLRLALNGAGSNHKFIDGHLVPAPGSHSYSHVYEFFDVQFRPEFADRLFQPPLGVVCPGRKSFKPLPKIPNIFKLSLEIVLPDMKRVFYMREYYSYQAKMVVYYYSFGRNGSQTPYRSLDDFNAGLTYRINMASGACNITPISLYSPDAVSPDNLHVQMKTSQLIFELDSERDWQYQGVTMLRDIETESWIVERTDWTPGWIPQSSGVNSTWEYYFSTGAWNTQGGFNKSSSMPVMAKVRWSYKTDKDEMMNGTSVINYFHFDTADVDFTNFDLSPCFSSVDSKELAFDISGSGIYNRYIANNTVEFYHGAAHSIAMAAGVTTSRIAQIFAAEGTDGVTTIFFSLLGVPAVKGDAVNMTEQLPLAAAMVNLEMKINGEVKDLFSLKFFLNGTETSLASKVDTLRASFSPNLPPEPDNSNQISTGAFVGFGVGMLVIGAVLGVAIALFIHKKTDLSVPYNVQS